MIDISISLSAWDWVEVAAYFVLLATVAIVVSWLQAREQQKAGGSSASYFLGNHAVPWYAVSASLFGSNIGSEHFVGLMGTGASNGIAVSWFELGAIPVVLTLAYVFLPLYESLHLSTMPEFLVRRYGGWARPVLVGISLILYVLTKIAPTLYGGVLVLGALASIDGEWIAVLLILATGLYTLTGGLSAVVWTEVVQTLVLLGGAVAVAVGAFSKAGGVETVFEQLSPPPNAVANATAAREGEWRWRHEYAVPYEGYDRTRLYRPVDDERYPMAGLLSGYFVLSLWYWSTDQTILQRALAASDPMHARGGTVGAAWMKLSTMFLMVFPGMAARVLMARAGVIPAGLPTSAVPPRVFDSAFPWLIGHVLPQGLRGIIIGATLGALMSSLASVFNSASTLVALDLYGRNPCATKSCKHRRRIPPMGDEGSSSSSSSTSSSTSSLSHPPTSFGLASEDATIATNVGEIELHEEGYHGKGGGTEGGMEEEKGVSGAVLTPSSSSDGREVVEEGGEGEEGWEEMEVVDWGPEDVCRVCCGEAAERAVHQSCNCLVSALGDASVTKKHTLAQRESLSETPVTERVLVWVGRITVVLVAILSLLWLPILPLLGDQIFVSIQKPPTYLAPPITTVFLWGAVSPQPTNLGAQVSLGVGAFIGILRLVLEVLVEVDAISLDSPFVTVHYLYFAALSFVLCTFLLFLVSGMDRYRNGRPWLGEDAAQLGCCRCPCCMIRVTHPPHCIIDCPPLCKPPKPSLTTTYGSSSPSSSPSSSSSSAPPTPRQYHVANAVLRQGVFDLNLARAGARRLRLRSLPTEPFEAKALLAEWRSRTVEVCEKEPDAEIDSSNLPCGFREEAKYTVVGAATALSITLFSLIVNYW